MAVYWCYLVSMGQVSHDTNFAITHGEEHSHEIPIVKVTLRTIVVMKQDHISRK